MRILIFVSVLGILTSVAVLIAVIIKSNRDKANGDGEPPPIKHK